MQVDAADRDKQLRIMTDQNAELLRLLEQEEAQTARLSTTNEVSRWTMDAHTAVALNHHTRTKVFLAITTVFS